MTSLHLTREQILGYRRSVGSLDRRLSPGPASLRRAAWAGLQDSMPRAALLSLHARVEDTLPAALDDASLVQLWGPRYSVFVVAAEDHAVFSFGRMPESGARADLAIDLATRLEGFLGDGEMPFGQAARAIGEPHNRLRYATLTGRVQLRWDGARQPLIRVVAPPGVGLADARAELARRYLHIYGPTTPDAFVKWAGIDKRQGAAAFKALREELVPVRTAAGDGWILAEDEPVLRAPAAGPARVRLLPSGDAYYLLRGGDRDLLVPDPQRRALLWTSRVWPGAVLVDGEVAGTWRRSGHRVTVEPWVRLARAAREAVEAEAASLPLPGVERGIETSWT